MAVNIIINGILGRMGREIAGIVLADDAANLIGCIEKKEHPAVGSELGNYIGGATLDLSISSSVKNIPGDSGVVIDFTSPESTRTLLEEIKGTSRGAVIGTTGLTEADRELMKKTSKTNPLLFSPNMSLGINFLFYLTRITAEKLGDDFNIEIIETHHKYKKDSPSGTAKLLGEIASAAIGVRNDETIKHGRVGIIGERSKKEIGIHSVRGGDIVGDHTVLFAGPGERLELKHTSHSRKTFAQGAVIGAKWLHSQGPGFYSMRDVLGF